MCGSFASEREVEVSEPVHDAASEQRRGSQPTEAAEHRPVSGDERRGVERADRSEMPRPSAAERELVLAHREAV